MCSPLPSVPLSAWICRCLETLAGARSYGRCRSRQRGTLPGSRWYGKHGAAAGDDINEAQFIKGMDEKGVKLIGMGSGKLRLVTHLDYTQQMHERFLTILSQMGKKN